MVLALSENVLPVADLVQALGLGWDSTKPVQFWPDSVGGEEKIWLSPFGGPPTSPGRRAETYEKARWLNMPQTIANEKTQLRRL